MDESRRDWERREGDAPGRRGRRRGSPDRERGWDERDSEPGEASAYFGRGTGSERGATAWRPYDDPYREESGRAYEEPERRAAERRYHEAERFSGGGWGAGRERYDERDERRWRGRDDERGADPRASGEHRHRDDDWAEEFAERWGAPVAHERHPRSRHRHRRREAGRGGHGAAEAVAGPHAGRGPKGWRRSDERIREDVCDRLESAGAIDASEIEVRCEEGVVTLEGAVEDRRTKRLAEQCAEDVAGVHDVMNRLRVDAGLFATRRGGAT